MKVKDFVSMEKSGAMFRLVDEEKGNNLHFAGIAEANTTN